jgi:hypothetical protein
MRAIRLDETDWLPAGVVAKLQTHREQLQRAPSFEDLIELTWARQLALQLDYILRASQIICYYCTREIKPGYLRKHGLPLRTIEQHQQDFLKESEQVLSEVEKFELKAEWDEYWQHSERQGFRTMVAKPSVGLDRCALLHDVGGSPHNYCGTHIVYEPVYGRPISWRLMELGLPCVAVIVLPGSEIIVDSLGEATLSHYYRNARSQSHREFRGFASNGIPARNIRAVIDWSPYRYDPGLTSTTLKLLDTSVNTA